MELTALKPVRQEENKDLSFFMIIHISTSIISRCNELWCLAPIRQPKNQLFIYPPLHKDI